MKPMNSTEISVLNGISTFFSYNSLSYFVNDCCLFKILINSIKSFFIFTNNSFSFKDKSLFSS